METIIGTEYFVSKRLAKKYYGMTSTDINQKIKEGAIIIGTPPTKQGERLILLDDGTRWGICKKGK